MVHFCDVTRLLMLIVTITTALGQDSSPTVPTSTTSAGPTPPPELCCTFSDDKLCGWSPAENEIGWTMSSFEPPTYKQPPDNDNGDYIYDQNDNGIAYSPEISDVTSSTKFTIDYWFETEEVNETNFMTFGFFNSIKKTIFYENFSPNLNNWVTMTFTCGNQCCMGTPEPCTGKFYVKVDVAPSTHQIAAIDNFHVDDTIC